MNELNFRESNSAIYIFATLLNEGPFLKERICSLGRKEFAPREQILSYKSRTDFLILLLSERPK